MFQSLDTADMWIFLNLLGMVRIIELIKAQHNSHLQ